MNRPGIVNMSSLADWAWSEILTTGINISYEEYISGVEEGDLETLDMYEENEDTYLFGDWILNENNQYEPDKKGKYGFVAQLDYSLSYPTVTIFYSKTISKTLDTSPCCTFNGGLRMGDLDNKRDFGEDTYDLPIEWYKKEDIRL